MTDTTARPTDRIGKLVDADWLEQHLDDPNVKVVEVDVSPAAHSEGHIPGAVLWNIYSDLKDETYRTRSDSAITELVRRSGIDNNSTVVFYGYAPALGFWVMQLLGHSDMAILDTGRDTWKDEGRPWTDDLALPSSSDFRVDRMDTDIRASDRDVRESTGRWDHTILDVRSRLEFEGERFWPSGGIPEGGRAGRIPSAHHLTCDEMVGDDGAFRSVGELTKMTEGLDLLSGHGLTTYCTIGARAAMVWFVLTHLLEHPEVRVYDGSWAEWGMNSALPIDQG